MFKLNLFDEGAESSTAETPSASSPEETGSQPEEKLYTKTDMSNAVKERVKSLKAKEAEANERLKSYDELHRRLAARYGTDDIAELQEKILSDDLFIESESVKRNMGKEATRLQIEREYRERRELERAREAQAEAERQKNVIQWRAEEAELQQTFPNFSLNEEWENPQFADLLMSGIPVRNAYMALHAEDIMQGSVQVAYEKGREAVASSIAANAGRPLENGVSSKPAVNTAKKISELTDSEMDAISERVRRGEKVYLRDL